MVGRKIRKAYRERQVPHGKQSVRKLMAHGTATNSIELSGDAKSFDRVARKWNVDYCPAYLWRSLTGGGAYAEKIRGGWNALMEWKNAGGVYRGERLPLYGGNRGRPAKKRVDGRPRPACSGKRKGGILSE